MSGGITTRRRAAVAAAAQLEAAARPLAASKNSAVDECRELEADG